MGDRREEIVRVALDLLREEGAKGLSQPQVAKRAGIPQGHLTYYFPRKADLVAAVARLLQQETDRDLARIASRALASDAHAASAQLLEDLILDRERSRAVLGLTIESERDPEVRDVLLEIVERGRPGLAFLLGVDSADPMVDLLQAVTWGLQLQQLLHRRGRAAVKELVERLLAWLEREQAARTARAGSTRRSAARRPGTAARSPAHRPRRGSKTKGG